MIRTEQLNKTEIQNNLNAKGYTHLPQLLNEKECQELRALYSASIYRNTIAMQRYRFGVGEYKYFAYPLPPLIQKLREDIYEILAPVANAWMQQLALSVCYPTSHSEFIELCHNKKQLRPTPLILHYEKGGFNTLHQDLYGALYFPFQMMMVLTQVGRDHEGGELVLTEQVPRAQSKAEVINPHQGDAIIFTTNFRPVKGSRGFYRATVKHGVSEIKKGERYALGIIFHDAE